MLRYVSFSLKVTEIYCTIKQIKVRTNKNRLILANNKMCIHTYIRMDDGISLCPIFIDFGKVNGHELIQQDNLQSKC